MYNFASTLLHNYNVFHQYSELISFLSSSSTKKLKTSKYSRYETIHFLFEAFFNIMENKRDI